MHRKLIPLLAIIGALLAVFSPAQAQTQNTAAFEAAECPFSNITAIRIDCGWLTVPENHADPTGASIRLAVSIIRATGVNRHSDPVIYLAGGPGAGVVWMTPRLAIGLAQTTRDIVLVDQRGMGLSEPGLYCPQISEWMLLSGTNIENEIRNCHTDLEARGIHPEFYTTEQNAADIETLRLALGYEQVNLFGVSYGTRLALTVLRDFPQGLRSVVLDSTHPPQIMYGEDGGAENAFERSFGLFERMCAEDVLCRTAYPNLRETYIAAYEHLNAAPIIITINGQPISFNGTLLETLVYTHLYRPTSLVLLPALIYAAAENDESILRDALEPMVNPPAGQGRSLGTTLTILCSENAALMGYENSATNPAFANPIPAINGAQSVKNCAAWGIDHAERPAPAVNDTVPVLILAGEFDPATNPDWGLTAAKTLAKAVYVRFPNTGHGVSDSACGGAIYAHFLDNPASTPDTSCISSIAAPAFVLDASRTRPVVIGLGLLFAAVGAWGMAVSVRAIGKRRFRPAWRAAFRKMGWIPAVISVGLLGLIATGLGGAMLQADAAHMVALVIPIMAGIQAALIFAPDDEPALEAQLAAPRPITWLVGERLAAVLIVQGGIGVVGTIISLILMPEQSLIIAFTRWVAPTLFLSGLGLYVTLRTRVPLFGAVVVGLVWFGFSIFGDFFLPGKLFGAPLNWIQPFLWTIHAYLEPTALGLNNYGLNRLAVGGAGLALITLACNGLKHPEMLLMHSLNRTTRRKIIVHTPSQQPVNVQWTPRRVQVSGIKQFVSVVRNEYKLAARKRAVIVVAVVLFVAVLLGGTLINGLLSGALIVNPTALSPDQARHMTTLGAIMSIWSLLSAVLLLVVPLTVADAVTYDRQTGMSEILGGLPLPYGVYLAGKVVGTLLLLFTALIGALIFSVVLWVIKTGGLDWPPYLDMWLVGGGLGLLLNVPCAVLLGATQPTRLRAAGIVFAAFVVTALISVVSAGFDVINLMRPALFNHYLELFGEGVLNPANLSVASGLSVPGIQMMLVGGIVEIIVIAVIVRGLYAQRKVRG